MGAKADYTLKQAVAMVNFAAKQRFAHWQICEICRYASCRTSEPDFCAEEEYCDIGREMEKSYAKWKRRCKYAARREGVHITI